MNLHRAVAVAALLTIGVLLPARPVAAHPLDVYLQSVYVTPAPDAIAVELAVSPGVLVAPAALADLDTDSDQNIDERESGAFAAKLLSSLHLSADGTPLPLSFGSVDTPTYLAVQAGYGTVRIRATATGAPTTLGQHELYLRNDFTPRGAAYQINGLIIDESPVELGEQRRSPDQRESRISYRIVAHPVAATGAEPMAAAAPAGRLAGLLESPSLPLAVVLFGLGLAGLLGALHALTPGHAKTVTAAYLVGSGGSTRDALALGAVVTVTHTSSVIVIGLIALFAGQFLVPGVLVPALGIVSGALVLAIGVRLLLRHQPHRMPDHDHDRDPILVPAGHHHEHVHSHGGRPHTHALPEGGVTMRGLVAMGVSGGLVPCPEALGVMVVAVGVNRTVLGLGLILSFSLGLAAVLMGLGVLLVRSRGLLGRLERLGTRWTTLLPRVSAAVVSVLGAGLLVQGVAALT